MGKDYVRKIPRFTGMLRISLIEGRFEEEEMSQPYGGLYKHDLNKELAGTWMRNLLP